MRVEITRLTSWEDVVNAARFTQRKGSLGKEPSVEFKRKIVRSEHSPLRCLLFNIDLYDIASYTAGHFVRHFHAQPFVSTSRPDVDGNMKPRDEQLKSELVNCRLLLNAQEIINISKQRLCTRAELPTRKAWQEVIKELNETEPELAAACVPNCIYRGFCPEFECCGYAETEKFDKDLLIYRCKLNGHQLLRKEDSDEKEA